MYIASWSRDLILSYKTIVNVEIFGVLLQFKGYQNIWLPNLIYCYLYYSQSDKIINLIFLKSPGEQFRRALCTPHAPAAF